MYNVDIEYATCDCCLVLRFREKKDEVIAKVLGIKVELV